jgi:Fe-S-cluster-containing dehydrogenase component
VHLLRAAHPERQDPAQGAHGQAGTPADVAVPDGTIKVACQQACPVAAIEFGNIFDPLSAVSKAKAREHDYRCSAISTSVRAPRTSASCATRTRRCRITTLPLSRVEYKNKNYPPALVKDGHGATDTMTTTSTNSSLDAPAKTSEDVANGPR